MILQGENTVGSQIPILNLAPPLRCNAGQFMIKTVNNWLVNFGMMKADVYRWPDTLNKR